MTTRLVTGTILNPATGAPWAEAEVKFALDSTGVTLAPPGLYPPKSVTVVTDENGQLGEGAGVALWANAEGLSLTAYNVSIGGKYSFKFQLPAGVGAVDLAELRVAGLTTLALDDPFIAVVDSRIAAAILGDIPDVTTIAHGLMTAADKVILDGIPATVAAKAPLDSPAFTGTPTAPTPLNATSTAQLATTAFVHALLTDLIGTAPANLDTLQEIAAQLATDESAVAALITAVSLKANISSLAAVAFSGAKGDVGLPNVDNTSDANKPVSTAQQTALNLKAPLASPVFTTSITTPQIIGGSATNQSLTYKTTSGVGVAGADHVFVVGNDGATEALRLLNNGNAVFGSGATNPAILLGGTTSAHLMLKRVGTTLQLRTGDDGAFGNISVGNLTVNGTAPTLPGVNLTGNLSANTPNTYDVGQTVNRMRSGYFGTSVDVAASAALLSAAGLTLGEAANIVAGTATGTKIGTATGQKLGFWNVTPVVQQVLATGTGKTVDNIITLLQLLGLCKQS